MPHFENPEIGALMWIGIHSKGGTEEVHEYARRFAEQKGLELVEVNDYSGGPCTHLPNNYSALGQPLIAANEPLRGVNNI